MQTKNFKVSTKKKEVILAVIIFGVITGFAIYALYRSNELESKIVLGVLAVIGVVVIFPQISFYVDVKDDFIKVRTALGRKYSFTCSEITKVTCFKSTSTQRGAIFYIIINAKGRNVQMSHHMSGFSQMAQYLLNKREESFIKKSVISPKVVRELKECANGSLYGQKVREKMLEKGLINDELIKQEALKENLLDKEFAKQFQTVTSFNDIEHRQILFKRLKCFGEKNCCFVVYNNENEESLSTKSTVDDRYEGYLINKTEKGFGMFPFSYATTYLCNIEHTALLEKEYYFIPNENIKAVTIEEYNPPKGVHIVEIKLELLDRVFYLLANVNEPLLSYHNENLAEFLNTYTK